MYNMHIWHEYMYIVCLHMHVSMYNYMHSQRQKIYCECDNFDTVFHE